MFRVTSNAEYYRFLWNDSNSTGIYQRLELHRPNSFRVLNQTTGVAYPFGTWTILTAVCDGSQLQVFANQTRLLQTNVSTNSISNGSVAMYTSVVTTTTATPVPSLSSTISPTSTPTVTTTTTPTPSPSPTLATIQPQPTLQPGQALLKFLIKFENMSLSNYTRTFNQRVIDYILQHSQHSLEVQILLHQLRQGSVYAT